MRVKEKDLRAKWKHKGLRVKGRKKVLIAWTSVFTESDTAGPPTVSFSDVSSLCSLLNLSQGSYSVGAEFKN